jgi:mannosyltransferase OCH1-like enzyme/glycosyltransferase involved in cell wall biosynthesis
MRAPLRVIDKRRFFEEKPPSKQTPGVKFSVVLIAKNEEKSLPRLHKSLEEFLKRGGEVILLDTGSTDKTVELAESFGFKTTSVGERFIRTIPPTTAKDINHNFIIEGEANIVSGGDRFFDYSAARNYAASLASNDIVSMPDCDEQYTHLDIDAIEKVIADGYEQMEFHFIFAHDANGMPAVQFRQCKMYDRRKMKWQGLIHELLVGEAKRTYLPPSVLLLEHFQNQQQERSHSYLAGLALDCFEHPDNDRHSHYLARELFWTGRYHSAIKEFTHHISMKQWIQERAQSMIFIGDCHRALGDDEQALDWYVRAFNADGTRREPLIKLAEYWFQHNDPQKTACYAQAALEIPPNDCYCNIGAHYSYLPHEFLYWAFWYLGDKERSKEHWKKALDYWPTNPKYLSDSQFYDMQPLIYGENSIDGFMLPEELNWLYMTAKKMNTIAEIGSWKGRSSHALLTGCPGKVTCIDTFAGSSDPRDITNPRAKSQDIKAEFLKNVGYFPNLELLHMTSRQAAELCKAEGRKFDMVFIDADHKYECVKEDIELWSSLATRILCGHDYNPNQVKLPDGSDDVCAGVVKAVDELMPGIKTSTTIWYQERNQEQCKMTRIPKRIFTTWLSDEPIPSEMLKCIESLKSVKGYTFEFLTRKDCPKGIPYLDAALQANDWVKASDYFRVWELREHGGVYCDSDIEIFPGKNFDALLNVSFFASCEPSRWVANFLMGAEPGCPLLDHYLKEIEAKFTGKACTLFEAAAATLTPIAYEMAQNKMNGVVLLSHDYFAPYNHTNGTINITENTIAFHHFSNTWVKDKQSTLPRIAIIVPVARQEGLKRLLKSIDRLYYPKPLIKLITDNGPETVPIKVNKMAAQITDADCYVYAADDMEFDPWCLYRAVNEARGNIVQDHPFQFKQAPFIKGLVAFNSGPLYPDEGNICEHFLITKDLMDQLGEIFNEKFYHVGCDNLLWAKAKKLGQAIRCEDAKIIHHHFSKGAQMDETYQKGWSQLNRDRAILKEELAKLETEITNPDKIEVIGHIPKQIFTVWLGSEMPPHIKKWTDTHSLFGYEHKLITLENCVKDTSDYIKAILASERRCKWARAADYFRVYYLLHEGGIYCDADMEILPGKNFDGLLQHRMFVHKEYNGWLNGAIMGAEKGYPFLKALLYKMETENNGNDELNFDSFIVPLTMGMYNGGSVFEYASLDQLAHGQTKTIIPEVKPFNWYREGAVILPQEYFCPFDYLKARMEITLNTIAIHHFMNSWAPLKVSVVADSNKLGLPIISNSKYCCQVESSLGTALGDIILWQSATAELKEDLLSIAVDKLRKEWVDMTSMGPFLDLGGEAWLATRNLVTALGISGPDATEKCKAAGCRIIQADKEGCLWESQ